MKIVGKNSVKSNGSSANLPGRSWHEFFAETACKSGMVTAIMGAGLGICGFDWIDKKAEAGIVISGDPQADQRARNNGFGYSVQGGGNVGSIAVTNLDTGSVVHSSLVFVNPYTAISSAHQYLSSFGINQGYSVGIGANFNSGVFYTPSNIFIHPGYGGSGSSGIDLAVINFNVPVPVQQNLTFASSSATTGEDVWLSGFGRPGNRSIGELPQDGFIRAGTSNVRSTFPLLGDPLNYRNLLFGDFPDLPTAMRGSYGDSGGGVFSQNGSLYGLIVGGSSNISGSTSVFINTSLPGQRDFIDLHTVTAVPEPSSPLLLGLCAVGAGFIRRRQRFIAVRRTQREDDSITSELPQRSSGKLAKVVARMLGLGTALMGALLGLSEYCGIEQNKAEAGIVISGDPQADQRARDNGFGYSVEGGGNVGSLTTFSELGTFRSSLVFVNPYTAISSAHQFNSAFGSNRSYSAGTGSNYNSGSFYTPSNVFVHPTYGGTAGSGIDLAVINFNLPVPIQNNLVFESGRPSLNETVWHSGFGRSGSPDIGYVLQDGFLRAGTSIARNSLPILGGSSLLYQNTLFEDDPFIPNALRLAGGDSGGGTFSTRGGLYGINVGASTSISGSSSMFLNTSNPDVRSFIDLHTVTAVPEPSSFLMLGLCALGAGFIRRRQRFIAVQRTRSKDDSIASELPHRTSGKIAKIVARKLGLGTAMIGAGLGVSGYFGIDQNKAEAGIVISGDPQADQRARVNGFRYSVEGGGNVGSIGVTNLDTGSVQYSSLVFLNPYTAISDAHKFNPFFGSSQAYSVNTGANYNSGPVYVPSNIFKHPGYTGVGGQGYDLAVIQFSTPVPVLNNLAFAGGRPVQNEEVWLTGYGIHGSRDVGYLPQDGFIRAGTSIARNSPPLLGGDPLLYQNTLFEDDPFVPNSLRGAPGYSGGGVFSTSGGLYGLIIGGSTSISGSTSMFLNTNAPDARTFIDAYTVTSVPEPNSFLLLAAFTVGLSFIRRRRRLIDDRRTKIQDDVITSKLSDRTRSEFAQVVARKIGLGTVMMGAGLGLSGFGGIEENKAQAGIVISGDLQADQRARNNGFGYSVEGGGNVGALRYQSTTETVYSSLVFVNPFTAIATAHQFRGFGPGVNYSAFTGANYNSGSVFTPSFIFLHPNSAIDFAVVKFDVPVPIANDIVFGLVRPALNDSVWVTGYGRPGSRDTGYLLQDGNIRAGESTARLSTPLLGGDPRFYQNAIFSDDPLLPTQLRITDGDSGGGIFNQNGELIGLGWAASSSIDGSTSAFLNVLAPEVQSFLSIHITAVPEPNSFLMLGVCAVGAGFISRRRGPIVAE